MDNKSQVEIINAEINKELANDTVARALMSTTFKGLNAITMKQAMLEGMIRGFTFQNFLKKDVYALPYGQGYSLITSIDYSRKIGARSGIVGKKAPVFEMGDGDKIIACEVTVQKKIDDYVGDYTAKVYFSEYDKGGNLWKTKPRTMIAKVAEMHALRMACPEELAKQYIEEEIEIEDKNPRFVEAKESSESIRLKNLKKHDEETTIEEDKNPATDAKGTEDIQWNEPK